MREPGRRGVVGPIDAEHQRRDGDDEDAYDEDDEFCRTHQLRIWLFIFFCFGRKGIEIGAFAHLIGARLAGAAGNKGARIQQIAYLLLDGDRFARKKRFVDFHTPFRQDTVGGDLISEGEDDDIVEHDVLGGDLLYGTAAQHFGRGNGEKG